MSSPPPNADPSPAPSGATPAGDESETPAELVRERGEPLLDALEERVPGSRSHADATASWALAISVELGLGRERSLAVRETARLHDVGKVYAEAELLERPAQELDADAARRLDGHAAIGSRLAEGAGVPAAACGWLRYSRERYDGGGLPDGLFGGAIPLESRIIRTACAFATRLARAGSSPEWGAAPALLAIAELRAAAGTALDRGAVEALAAVLDRAEAG
jgi:HD-GYP domain-containing protein (c-di-GMP phosphodiesterase class II)